MPVGVILLAAGSGARLGAEVPKALCSVGGRTILDHSLTVLRAHDALGPIVVTAPASHADQVVTLVGSVPDVTVIAGGRTRQDSVRLALGVLPTDIDIVLVHDAARPFVTTATIDRVLGAVTAGAEAVVPVVEVVDTIKRVTPEGTVVGTVTRSDVRAVQTPQGFRRSSLEAAHRYARAAALSDVSDDAGLIERHGGNVVVVAGDDRTFKVTRPLDLKLAELVAGQAGA